MRDSYKKLTSERVTEARTANIKMGAKERKETMRASKTNKRMRE